MNNRGACKHAARWLLVCATVCLGGVAAAGDVAPSAAITVIDGDTVEQAGQRWRLAGIDAPEIHRAKCPEERRRGILGAARLIALLAERAGRLEPRLDRRGRPSRDKYGRALGRLVLGAEDWAEIAIREGHAVAWDGRGPAPDWCRGEGS